MAHGRYGGKTGDGTASGERRDDAAAGRAGKGGDEINGRDWLTGLEKEINQFSSATPHRDCFSRLIRAGEIWSVQSEVVLFHPWFRPQLSPFFFNRKCLMTSRRMPRGPWKLRLPPKIGFNEVCWMPKGLRVLYR